TADAVAVTLSTSCSHPNKPVWRKGLPAQPLFVALGIVYAAAFLVFAILYDVADAGTQAAEDYQYCASSYLGWAIAIMVCWGLIILTVKVFMPNFMVRAAVRRIPESQLAKVLVPDAASGLCVHEVVQAAPLDGAVLAYGRFDEKYDGVTVSDIESNLAAAGTDVSKLSLYQGHPFLYPTVASDSVSSVFWNTKDKYGLDTLIRAANEFHRVLP
ncbi:hypothetical protein KIPB_012408, partial [Kipferlia bialata]